MRLIMAVSAAVCAQKDASCQQYRQMLVTSSDDLHQVNQSTFRDSSCGTPPRRTWCTESAANERLAASLQISVAYSGRRNQEGFTR